MWISYEATFQKEKNQTCEVSFTSFQHRLLLLRNSHVRSRNQSLFPPLEKEKFFCSLARFFLNFPSFLRFTTGKKKGKPHDDALVLATGKRSESVERGRPMIRMERYSSQTDLRPFTPELTRVFVVVQGGRGTGNPGLTFSRMGRRRWLNREPSRSSCKHRLNGDQRRKRHKRPALSPWTVIFLPGRETSVRPFERL